MAEEARGDRRHLSQPAMGYRRLPPASRRQPSASLSRELVQKELRAAGPAGENRGRLEEIAGQRAEMLLADHRRVREAAQDTGSYRVKACLPVDVMGVYVLLPDEL